ncbi:MAG: ribosome small subunit-dependent GTPase A [Deltaproteobacteria bacterium]|nr:ribosome small subunit-dependent GTPase A [Myxococcales bacterium]MDP3212883.1 ribosome small subunit-dependent GTPase A [Deltaproteobacteria bacterium]
MNTEALALYERELGLRPVFIQQLMTGDGPQRPWRVAAVERGACTVLGFDEDGALIERRARTGALPVAVGDWVLLARVEQDVGQVERVLERATWLRRGSAHHEGHGQLIAANLDTVFIVVAFAETEKLERRSLRARRLDRFVSAVKEGGATPVVVLNKVDLTGREEDELAALRAELTTRLGGVEVLCAAALGHRGLDALAERLVPGDTVAFIGPSGVGKSSLINALLGQERQGVGGVRARDAKGKHTTTRRELLRMPSGALLIDTPGVREFAVLSDEGVAGFEDIDALAQRCRFSDCAHDTEPGCAVRAAVEARDLPAERLESYRDIERDAQRLRGRQDAYSRHLEHLEQRKFGRMVQSVKALKNKP